MTALSVFVGMLMAMTVWCVACMLVMRTKIFMRCLMRYSRKVAEVTEELEEEEWETD